jgi:multidrug efflux pump
MTTAAMVFGVVPLVIATGAGAAGRQAMGIVIFTGMAIGTLFTLFVVPAMYLFLATDRSKHAHAEDGPTEALGPTADGAPHAA